MNDRGRNMAEEVHVYVQKVTQSHFSAFVINFNIKTSKKTPHTSVKSFHRNVRGFHLLFLLQYLGLV